MKIRKYQEKKSPAHLVWKFVREFQYQGISVSRSRWASRMNLINSPKQQNLIIRWCCLRLSLAFELENLNCVTSSGFPFCQCIKERLCRWKEIFCWAMCESSVGRVKNYKWMHLTQFCFLVTGISTRFVDVANMEGAKASGLYCWLCH